MGHLRIASLERMFICIEAGSFINTIGEVNLPIYGGKIMGSEGFTAMAIVPDDVSPSIIRHTFDPKQVYAVFTSPQSPRTYISYPIMTN